MADPAQEIARYKALLVKAKGAIDVQRQQVTEKQREIERLNEELREAQARAAADQDSAEPARILRQLQQGGRTWCLFEYVDENLTDSWRSFSSEAQLRDAIRKEAGEPLDLPAASLSPEQAVALREEADKAVEEVREEFRRYRVRSEIMRKQKDEEVRKAVLARNAARIDAATAGGGGGGGGNDASGSGSGGAGVGSGGGGGSAAEVAELRAQVRRLQPVQQELQRQERQCLELQRQLDELGSGAAEAALAAQWRQRFDTAAEERDAARKRVDQLESDFAKYRTKALAVLEEKERLLREGGGGGAAAGGGGAGSGVAVLSQQQVQYLKNVVLQYMTEPQVREHMEGAIATVLQFSPAEMMKVQQTRGGGGKGAALGLGLGAGLAAALPWGRGK